MLITVRRMITVQGYVALFSSVRDKPKGSGHLARGSYPNVACLGSGLPFLTNVATECEVAN